MRTPAFLVLVFFTTVLNATSLAQSCSPCDSIQFQPGVIFCDDFESDEPIGNRYFGYDTDEGEFIRLPGVGRAGSHGMRVKFQAGEVGAGVLQKAIGRSPDSGMTHRSMPDSNFKEIYWRIDIRNQPGWEGGGGDKLSRATVIASKSWQQGMIAHVWSGGKPDTWDYLVMDPASGISTDSKLASKKYNDFANLRWMDGTHGPTPLFRKDLIGQWNCVVAHVKLNTPGISDGVFELWVNGRLQGARYDLNWHASWNLQPDSYGINAVFFENYWNKGSVKEQERYFDNILISTQPISCNCLPQ
jgi:hypothetical protein